MAWTQSDLSAPDDMTPYEDEPATMTPESSPVPLGNVPKPPSALEALLQEADTFVEPPCDDSTAKEIVANLAAALRRVCKQLEEDREALLSALRPFADYRCYFAESGFAHACIGTPVCQSCAARAAIAQAEANQ